MYFWDDRCLSLSACMSVNVYLCVECDCGCWCMYVCMYVYV